RRLAGTHLPRLRGLGRHRRRQSRPADFAHEPRRRPGHQDLTAMTDSTFSLIPTTPSATGSIADKVASSASRLADAQQTFLKLLTTQLKNQDPLSPLDSNQFTQQIVQMTGVEQQLYSNQLLQQLVNQGGMGLSSSVGLIGKTVAMQGDTN